MRLLLGDANFRKNVENRFAFNFQLPGQIVDSNLTHPPLISSATVPLSPHINLTVLRLLRRFEDPRFHCFLLVYLLRLVRSHFRIVLWRASFRASASGAADFCSLRLSLRHPQFFGRGKIVCRLLRLPALRLLRPASTSPSAATSSTLTDGFAAFQGGEVIIDRDTDFFHRLRARFLRLLQAARGSYQPRASTVLIPAALELFDQALAQPGQRFQAACELA